MKPLRATGHDVSPYMVAKHAQVYADLQEHIAESMSWLSLMMKAVTVLYA